MDELSTMIEGMRAQGYSDDQIRQTLLATGWSQEEIELILPSLPSSASPPEQVQSPTPVPPPAPTPPARTETPATPPQPSHDEVPQPLEATESYIPEGLPPARSGPPVKIIALLGGGFLVIFLVVAAVLFAVVRRSPAPGAKESPGPTATSAPVASEPVATSSALVLYTRTDSASSSAYFAFAFDLTTGKRENLTERLLGSRDGIVRLCRFSPDGAQMPILSYDSAFTTATISAFFTDTLRLEPRSDITARRDRNVLATRYGSTCRWLDESRVLIGRDQVSTGGATLEKRIILEADNTITEETASPEADIATTYNFGAVVYVVPSTRGVATPKARRIESRTAAVTLEDDEFPLGQLGEVFYTIARRGVTSSATLDQADSTAETNTYAIIPYTGNALAKGDEIPYEPDSGYRVIAAVPHPDGKRIVIREDDASTEESLVPSQYIVFDPATGYRTPVTRLTAFSTTPFGPSIPFRVTGEGRWIVSPFYKRAADGRSNEVSVRAWNIETGKETIVCERFCRAYEAFMPGQSYEE
ncbi:MAG: hypothetical protein N2691_06135 [Patescibacteria group bacterium]|nr:hypothetical protein [Patescibacteria group bacterium]